jgi:hypothetical protein
VIDALRTVEHLVGQKQMWWGAAVHEYGQHFLATMRRLGIRSAPLEEGGINVFVRRRMLPRVAQMRCRDADALDIARSFAAAVQDTLPVNTFVDCLTPIDLANVAMAKRLEGTGYVCLFVIVPLGDSPPEVCELTPELVARTLAAYRNCWRRCRKRCRGMCQAAVRVGEESFGIVDFVSVYIMCFISHSVCMCFMCG